jgi:hypothetical protein
MKFLFLTLALVASCGQDKKSQDNDQSVQIIVNPNAPQSKLTRADVEKAINTCGDATNKFLDLAQRRFINPNAPFVLAATDLLSVLATFKREVQSRPQGQFQVLTGTVTQRYQTFNASFSSTPYASDPAFANSANDIKVAHEQLVNQSTVFATQGVVVTGGNNPDNI